jgi:hypothetical protein
MSVTPEEVRIRQVPRGRVKSIVTPDRRVLSPGHSARVGGSMNDATTAGETNAIAAAKAQLSLRTNRRHPGV